MYHCLKHPRIFSQSSGVTVLLDSVAGAGAGAGSASRGACAGGLLADANSISIGIDTVGAVGVNEGMMLALLGCLFLAWNGWICESLEG